jgi:hypothetical protein
MYKIIGGDSKEYGPVSFDQLCQWITEGRANANSLVQGAGSTEWKPMGSFPEFTDVLRQASAAMPAVQSPAQAGGPYAAQPGAVGGRLVIGRCFETAWRVLRTNPVLVLASAAVIILIDLAVQKLLPTYKLPFPMGPGRMGVEVPVYWSLFNIVFEGLLHGSLFALYLKLVRGEWTSINEVIEKLGPRVLPLIAASMVTSLLSGLGLVCLIIPGVYLTVAWSFTYLVIVDQKLDFWSAMERSRKAVNPQFWTVLGLILMLAIMLWIGMMIHPVMRFLIFPYAALVLTCAYDETFRSGPASETSAQP